MFFLHKHVSPLCNEILKVSGKKILSLFVLIHFYKNLSEKKLIRFWPLCDVITIFLVLCNHQPITNQGNPPPPYHLNLLLEHHCVLCNQISLRGAWPAAAAHLKLQTQNQHFWNRAETEGIMGCCNALPVGYFEPNTSETCFVYI